MALQIRVRWEQLTVPDPEGAKRSEGKREGEGKGVEKWKRGRKVEKGSGVFSESFPPSATG